MKHDIYVIYVHVVCECGVLSKSKILFLYTLAGAGLYIVLGAWANEDRARNITAWSVVHASVYLTGERSAKTFCFKLDSNHGGKRQAAAAADDDTDARVRIRIIIYSLYKYRSCPRR